jgi:hypothetical protein
MYSKVSFTVGSKIKEALYIDANDTEFGAIDTYDLEKEQVSKNEYLNNEILNIPIYGVRKLANPEELTTDFLDALLCYDMMASEYE